MIAAALGTALPARDQGLYQELQRHLGSFDYRASGLLLKRLLASLPDTSGADHEQ